MKALAGLQTAIFSICLHTAFPQCVQVERESSSYKALIPSWGPTLVTSSKLNYLPKTPPPNTITLGARVSTYDFRGTQFSLLQEGSTAIPWLMDGRVKKKCIVCMSDSTGQKRKLLHKGMKVNQD